MGLKNTNDCYYRITHVDVPDSRVHVELFEDLAISLRPLTRFERKLTDSIHCGNLADELAEMADAGKSIRDNLWTAAYLALKNEPPYREMEDVFEEGQP